ncbi:unnamed protein product [Rhizoctonia solani]|uniref:Peptidase C14 caspase domain-containing protein n=1 Tax=Rhizoctonia solani TaxID=456999 RepID=A0A8H3HQT2_9AGAM|nr:unnamed protein product [Rhizoctonia solani]
MRGSGPLTISWSRANMKFIAPVLRIYLPALRTYLSGHVLASVVVCEVSSQMSSVMRYPGQVWPDGADMSISLKCIVPDARRTTTWTGQFNRTLIGYHDITDASGRKNPACEPSAENMRKLLEDPRDLPTFIYVSGHTDSSNGEKFYLTSDCVVNGSYDSSRVIPYSEFRDKLLLEHHQEPVVLVTDVCDCDNLMKLPYVYSYENGKVTCTKTEYHNGADWDSLDVVHFAATSPNQQAAFFASGSVYNQALHSVSLEKGLSLEETVRHIQIQMDELLGVDPKKYPSQTHRVYSSRKFDGNDFFGTLGFSYKQSPVSQ